MTTQLPRRISRRWLDQQKTKLGCTIKNLDGKPNPHYARLATEIETAEAELDRRERFEAWAKSTLDAILNQYSLRDGTRTYEPGEVFFKKDKGTGKTTCWTVEQAWQKYQDANTEG